MKFKAGTYYVGDLCYVISDDNWDKLLDETNYLENDNLTFKGESIWSHGTCYGDGSYTDQKGRKYGVDAGIIGIMPAHLRDDENENDNIITFEKDFEVSYEDGVFLFGDIQIDTGYTDEYEDEDDEFCGCCGCDPCRCYDDDGIFDEDEDE